MKIIGYCVYPNNEDFDHALMGGRRHRMNGKYTVIYCETEDEAKEMSEKITDAKFGPYYALNTGYEYPPGCTGTMLY